MITINPIKAKDIIVPKECSMRQARLALLASGNLAAVESYIAAMAGVEGDASRIEWDYGTVVMRSNSLVLTVLPAIGLTAEDIDTLFINAVLY